MPCAARNLDDSPCALPSEHWHCISCSSVLFTPFQLCPHHGQAFDDRWAASNRAMCDGLHRGEWAARLPEAERADYYVEAWAG
jgi:hypothetical protein